MCRSKKKTSSSTTSFRTWRYNSCQLWLVVAPTREMLVYWWTEEVVQVPEIWLRWKTVWVDSNNSINRESHRWWWDKEVLGALVEAIVTNNSSIWWWEKMKVPEAWTSIETWWDSSTIWEVVLRSIMALVVEEKTSVSTTIQLLSSVLAAVVELGQLRLLYSAMALMMMKEPAMSTWVRAALTTR